jgi:hypothetical protein
MAEEGWGSDLGRERGQGRAGEKRQDLRSSFYLGGLPRAGGCLGGSQLPCSGKSGKEWFSLRENHEEACGFGLHQLQNCFATLRQWLLLRMWSFFEVFGSFRFLGGLGFSKCRFLYGGRPPQRELGFMAVEQ